MIIRLFTRFQRVLSILSRLYEFRDRIYLDPGSASILLQYIIGSIAAVIVILKLYWKKFKAFFGIYDSDDKKGKKRKRKKPTKQKKFDKND